MATTSIDGGRGKTGALERYDDAVFMRDDYKFYFGNGGDVSLHWDATNSHWKLVGYPSGISDQNPGLSDAVFLKSDTTSTTAYLLSVSTGT